MGPDLRSLRADLGHFDQRFCFGNPQQSDAPCCFDQMTLVIQAVHVLAFQVSGLRHGFVPLLYLEVDYLVNFPAQIHRSGGVEKRSAITIANILYTVKHNQTSFSLFKRFK
ncbi:hypothetical protein D3C85_1561550 [compost metagenome]